MKQITTMRGTTIQVDDNGIATAIPANGKKLPGEGPYYIGQQGRYDANGERYRSTLLDKKCLEIYTRDGRTGIRLGIEDVYDWLDENWPIRQTWQERFEAMKPNGVDAMREYNDAWNTYHRRFNRRMEDENLSSITLPSPKNPKPELSDEAVAWMHLDEMRYAGHYAKSSAAEKAIKRLLADELTLKEAADAADKEWSEYCRDYTD